MQCNRRFWGTLTMLIVRFERGMHGHINLCNESTMLFSVHMRVVERKEPKGDAVVYDALCVVVHIARIVCLNPSECIDYGVSQGCSDGVFPHMATMQ